MGKSSAYETGYAAGQVLGGVIVLLLLAAILGFFIFALVKACTRRTTGWIVTTVVMGVMGLGVLVLGVAGLAFGLVAVAKQNKVDKVMTSDDGRFSLSVPGSWKSMPELNDVACIEGGSVFPARYALVIAEDRKDFEGSLADFATVLADHIEGEAENGEASSAESLTVGSYPAIRYRIAGTVEKHKIAYHLTCVETPSSYCQILCWSLGSDEHAAKPVFDKVAASFVEKGE